MLSFKKSFHLEFAQVAESTSQKLSGESSALYFDQAAGAPRNGTRAVENAKNRRDLWLSTLSMLSLLAVLFLTACGPRGARLQPSEHAPDETAVVVLSGGSSIPGEASLDSTIVEVPAAPSTASAPAPSSASNPDSLAAFAKEPAVTERVRLVLGWLEFFRNQTVLPGIKVAWSDLMTGGLIHPVADPIPESELAEAKVSKMEFLLWRELLRSSILPKTEGATSHSSADVLNRLDRLALLLTAAERPEDLQDLDRWLMAN